MGPTAFRDGIFSQTAPTVRYQGGDQRAYSDGSLGAAPRAFRDGVFSQTDPLAPYGSGSGQTAYNDGSLGFFGEGFTPWTDRSATSKAQVVGVLGGGAAAGYVLSMLAGAKPIMAGLGAAVGGVAAFLVGSAVAKGK